MRKFEVRAINKGASSEITREGYSIDKKGVTAWLIGKNLISAENIVRRFSDVSPWLRTGGETYCTVFEIETRNWKRQFVIKAIVTLFPEKSLLDWKRRREILSDNDIPVSKWYFSSGGTIYEEFYPFKAKDRANFNQLLKVGCKLDALGFETLKFVDDILVDDEGDLHYVDFGFDLGEPTNKGPVLNAQRYLIKLFPNKRMEIINFFEQNIPS